MSVTVRPYQGTSEWEADIRVLLPDGTRLRERLKTSCTSRSAAQRWGEQRERVLLLHGKPQIVIKKGGITLREFHGRFMDDYAKANQLKPSGIAAKETIFRVHLIPQLGDGPLETISTADVQRLKASLTDMSPKTVNNVLTVLRVALKTAVEWGIIERVPCELKVLRTPRTVAAFHDFDDYRRLAETAKRSGVNDYLIVLLGGEAGLRCGELMALEWADVDLTKRQVAVARSEWKGQVTATKGGRVRHVPLTERLATALRNARHLRAKRILCDVQGHSMTQKQIQRVMLNLAREADVKPGVHILRHTFCSHLAMRGAPAVAIQELAGHQDLRTTQRYMHLSRGRNRCIDSIA